MFSQVRALRVAFKKRIEENKASESEESEQNGSE